MHIEKATTPEDAMVDAFISNLASGKKRPISVSIPEKLQLILQARQAAAKTAVEEYTQSVDRDLQRTIADTLNGFLATLDLPENTKLAVSDDFTQLTQVE